MRMKLKKYISSVILMALSLLIMPVELLHGFAEEHQDEVHLCHNDQCLRTFEGHCQLCDHTPPVYLSFRIKAASKLRIKQKKEVATATAFYYSNHHLLPANKAPPVS